MTARTLPIRFNQAIERKDADAAWQLAKEFPRLSLDQALSLTILLGIRSDARFVPAARRFLERFIAEAKPELAQIKRVADALDSMRLTGGLPALQEGAERALEDLARQLRGR